VLWAKLQASKLLAMVAESLIEVTRLLAMRTQMVTILCVVERSGETASVEE
jgi:hypothetical protein